MGLLKIIPSQPRDKASPVAMKRSAKPPKAPASVPVAPTDRKIGLDGKDSHRIASNNLQLQHRHMVDVFSKVLGMSMACWHSRSGAGHCHISNTLQVLPWLSTVRFPFSKCAFLF